VSYQLSAYGGQDPENLFVGAIPQNPFWPTQRTVEEVEFQYSRLLHNTSCSSLGCLRELDQSTLLAAAPNSAFPESEPGDPTPLWYWLPVIDGDLVKDHMYKLFRQGKFRRVSTLVGDDTNEGTYFGYNAKSEAEVLSFMRANYPCLNDSQLSSIAKLYPLMDPLPKHNAYFPSAAAAYGDSTFTCPGNMIAESLAQYLGPKRVWNYRYNVLDPANVANGLGAPHTFETSAIFGPGFAGQIDNSYYTTNAGIVPVTMAYFLSFVRFLDPNTARYEGAPVWMPWGAGMEKGERLRLQTNDTAMESVTGELVEKCMLWKRLALQWRFEMRCWGLDMVLDGVCWITARSCL
jgi:carboxylesterase type B